MIPRHLKELIKNSTDIRKNSVFLWLQIPMMVPKNMQNLLNSKTILIYATYAINDFIKKAENSAELLQLNDGLKA